MKIEAYVIAFDEARSNIDYIRDFLLANKIRLKWLPARKPSAKDVKRLDAYARWLIFGCRDRYTHMHYSYLGALGCTLSHLALWEKCAKSERALLVFEENAKLKKENELMECLRVFEEAKLDFLTMHTWGDIGCRCPRRSSVARATIATLAGGKIEALTTPEFSTKCYVISPRFARHLVKLCSVSLPSVQVDAFITLNASPYGGVWKGARYEPKKSYFVQAQLKSPFNSLKIAHTAPIRC